MYDHHYDTMLWREPRERLHEGGRLSHLVFVDGRLVDAWSEHVEVSTYADVARRHDEDLRPPVVQAPPPLPHHEQALRWLDCVAGSREELLAMTSSPVALPRLRDHLDPVADEAWLVADELLGDLRETLLPADLAAPLRECLLLARDRLPELAERMTPARLAGGVAWVVGKANAAVLRLLAKALGLPKSVVTLVSGETARLKTVHVDGDPDDLAARSATL